MDLPGIPAAPTDFEVAQLRLVHGHTVGQASAYTWLWKKPAMDTRWYENIKQCNNFQKQRIWHFMKQIVQELPSATCSRRNTLLSTHMAIKIVVLRTYGQLSLLSLSQALVGSQRSQVTPLHWATLGSKNQRSVLSWCLAGNWRKICLQIVQFPTSDSSDKKNRKQPLFRTHSPKFGLLLKASRTPFAKSQTTKHPSQNHTGSNLHQLMRQCHDLFNTRVAYKQTISLFTLQAKTANWKYWEKQQSA